MSYTIKENQPRYTYHIRIFLFTFSHFGCWYECFLRLLWATTATTVTSRRITMTATHEITSFDTPKDDGVEGFLWASCECGITFVSERVSKPGSRSVRNLSGTWYLELLSHPIQTWADGIGDWFLVFILWSSNFQNPFPLKK